MNIGQRNGRKFFGFLIVSLMVAVLSPWAAANQRITVLWPTYTQEKIEFGQFLVESFQAVRPDVEVDLVLEYARLPIMIASGMAPDVTWEGTNGFSRATEGWYKDLSEYVARDAAELDTGDFFDALWEHTEWRGKRWGMPLSVNLGIYYYNQRMFDERGLDYPTGDWSTNDLIGAARRLTRDADGDGTTDLYGLSLELANPTWFFAYGGPIISEDWSKSLFDNDARRQALEFYYDVQNIYEIAPPPAVLRAYARSNSSPLMFLDERLGITFGGIAGTMGTLRAAAQFEWDVNSWPWLEVWDHRERATTYTPESLVIPADAANPDLAWEFIKHAMSVEIMAEVTRRGHVFPTRRSVLTSDAWSSPDVLPRNNQAFLDSLAVARPHIGAIHTRGTDLNRSTGAIANDYVAGKLPLVGAVEQIDRVIQALLEE